MIFSLPENVHVDRDGYPWTVVVVKMMAVVRLVAYTITVVLNLTHAPALVRVGRHGTVGPGQGDGALAGPLQNRRGTDAVPRHPPRLRVIPVVGWGGAG